MCDCLSTLEEALKRDYSQLTLNKQVGYVLFNTITEPNNNRRLCIRAKVVVQQSRNPNVLKTKEFPVNLFAKYCPFCGSEYHSPLLSSTKTKE